MRRSPVTVAATLAFAKRGDPAAHKRLILLATAVILSAANAVIERDPAGNRKLTKAKSTGRIDGLQALAMAMGAASTSEEIQTYDADSFMFV